MTPTGRDHELDLIHIHIRIHLHSIPFKRIDYFRVFLPSFFSFFSLFGGFRAIGFRVVLLSFLAGTYFWRFTHAKCLSKLLPKVLF